MIEEPTPWLALPPLDTEYAWVLESGVLPFSDQYLKHMVGLLNTPEYHDALLGSQATLLPSNFNGHGELVCFPEAFRQLPHVTQPVDTIHRSWLLRTSWIPLLLQDPVQGPLAFHISRALWFHGGIVSVALPDHVHYRLLLLDDRQTSCADMHHALNTDATWRALLDLRTTPAALDFRQVRLRAHKQLYTLAFVLDGPDQASALYPLMCSFDYTVHAIVTGRYRGLSGAVLEQTLATTGCERVIVHDLNLDPPDEHAAAAAISFGVRRLLQALASPPFVYVQGTGAVPRALEMMGDTLTAISLPIDQIEHALWLSKLPYRALQRKFPHVWIGLWLMRISVDWNTPEIDIVVVTDRRPHSLSRLIQSAERSYFLGDRVNLAIQMEQSSDRVTRMYVNSLQWVHGQKVVRHRIRKGGLMPAIIESWYPSNDDNYAVLLEDDVEVSPLFYVWAKYSILQYRYGDASQNARHLMFGVSLYSPRSVELNPEGRRPFHPDNVLRNYYPPRTPYASQIPCSWGAVYFPEHWREFHEYLTIRLLDLKQDRLLNITVPRSRSSRWKKSWKKYFIEMVYLRGYVMLYPNFQEFESFSTNHLETGTHIKTPEKRVRTIRDFLVPLMQRDTIVEQLPDHRLPMFDDLPVLDLWGLLATYPQLNDTGARWHQRVSTCVRKGLGQFDARDMVCPFPIPWETRQSMSASYSMSSESASLSRAMKSQTVYAVEPIDYVTYTGAYPADVVEDEEDYMPEAIDVAQMPSEPDDGSILDDDAELDLIRDLDHLPQIPLDLQEVLLADAEQDL